NLPRFALQVSRRIALRHPRSIISDPVPFDRFERAQHPARDPIPAPLRPHTRACHHARNDAISNIIADRVVEAIFPTGWRKLRGVAASYFLHVPISPIARVPTERDSYPTAGAYKPWQAAPMGSVVGSNPTLLPAGHPFFRVGRGEERLCSLNLYGSLSVQPQ